MWKFIPKRAFNDFMNTTAPTTDINPIPKALTVPEKLARAVVAAAAGVQAPVVKAVAVEPTVVVGGMLVGGWRSGNRVEPNNRVDLQVTAAVDVTIKDQKSPMHR